MTSTPSSVYSVKLIYAILLSMISSFINAQSDNYWSWNFNTPSTLLAGAVVGGHAGPSAIYYNPALIDHENIPSLSLSANILSLQFFKANNIAGQGIDADKFIFKIQPRFISYTIPTKNKKLGAEVAILSPVSEQILYTLQHTDELDIIQRTVGMEIYSGYLNYQRKYDDTWIGGGLSYHLSDNFYIGASSFLSIKVLKFKQNQIAKAYQEGDSVSTVKGVEPKYIAESSFEEEFKYWYLSFIFKLGVQFKTNNQKFSAGLNITFPDIPFIGNADIRKSVSRSNVYNDLEDAFTTNQNTIQVEEKTKVRVKNPWSIALGAQYSTNSRKNSILFTVEYFHQLDPYAITNSSLPTPEWLPKYITDNINEGDFMSYYFEAGSVINAAIGFKQYISPSLFFLGGFRTDFTASDTEDYRFVGNRFSVNQINMDKYHITAGAVLRIKKFKVISGIQYSRGRNRDMKEMVNYSNPLEYNPLTEQALEGVRQGDAEAIINEIALFFGLSVDIGKNKE